MSELASEITGTHAQISDVEFLGRSFAERRDALMKTKAFAEMTRRALADSVEALAGQELQVTFRPSMALVAKYEVWVPCYSSNDKVRKPLERTAVVVGVNPDSDMVHIVCGEQQDGRYAEEWEVLLGNIISLKSVTQTEASA